MVQFETVPLAFGALMAGLDVVTFSLVRLISTDKLRLIRWMILPTLLYALQPWILLSALKFETLIVMNLMWDVLSDILVTLMGYFYFGERIGKYKIIGVIFAFAASIFMSLQENAT